MMTESRIDFGLTGGGVEDIVVADAFLFRKFDWQKQQRGMDALIRSFLEVIPTQETQDETKLGEAVLGAVAFGFTDDFVEHAGDVGSIFEAQVFAERHGGALR